MLSVRLGDGRTVRFPCAEGLPAPYAYWPRSEPEPVWRWACRVCGTVEDQWAWRDIHESAPMVRQAYNFEVGAGGRAVVLSASRMHRAPRWHVTEPAV